MKKTIAICLLLCLCLGCFGGCAGRTEPASETSDGLLSPGLELLRRQAAAGMRFCTPKNEDKVFSASEFREKLGVMPEYLVIGTLPAPEDGTLLLNGRAVLAGQTVPASALDQLRLIPGQSRSGSASFTVNVRADGWDGVPVRCVVSLLEHENFAPVAADAAVETLAGVSCFVGLERYAQDPDGDGVELRIVTYPRHGTLSTVGGETVYTPEAGFRGKDTVVFRAVDPYGAVSRESTVTITVAGNETGLVFADLERSPAHLAAVKLCASEVMTYREKGGKYYFEPDGEVSKIDCLVMMMCLRGLKEDVTAVADTEALDDEGLSSGKKGFLAYAISEGYVHLEDGRFDPNAPVTAADAAFMAQKLLGIPALAARQEFSDLASAPAWASGSLIAADSAGILRRDGILDAGQTLDRAGVAALLFAMDQYRV